MFGTKLIQCGAIAIVILACGAAAQFVTKFDICRDRVNRILNGTETFGDVTNVTIWTLNTIYTGTIHGLDPRFSDHEILALTYAGRRQ